MLSRTSKAAPRASSTMQNMAHLQAVAGSASAAGDAYPFSTLAVWRDKLRSDVSSAEGFKPTLLMQQVRCRCHRHRSAPRTLPEVTVPCGPVMRSWPCAMQGKDVEQAGAQNSVSTELSASMFQTPRAELSPAPAAVLGCLKDCLYDLHEGVTWGMLDPEFEGQQRQALINAAANELNTDKQLCVQLAHEQGVLEQFADLLEVSRMHACGRPAGHPVAGSAATRSAAPTPGPIAMQQQRGQALDDYRRVGELRFALLVWRANLRRDVALARNPAARGSKGPHQIEPLLRSAYRSALCLIKDCADHSTAYWAGQQARNAPHGDSKRRLHAAAVQVCLPQLHPSASVLLTANPFTAAAPAPLQRVRSSLLELADTFGVELQAMEHLFEEVQVRAAVSLPGPARLQAGQLGAPIAGARA